MRWHLGWGLIVVGLLVGAPGGVRAAPSNTMSVTNTFVNGTTADGSQVNQNYNDVVNTYNTHTHQDLTASSFATNTAGGVMTWNGSGVATVLNPGTAGQALTTGGASAVNAWAGMTTQGDVEYMGATTRARLGAGTAGQALTTGGAAANPAFAGMTTQGDIEYHNGTTRTRLGPGTSGQFLKTQGAGANPLWATVSATGAQSANYVSATDAQTTTSTTWVDMPSVTLTFTPAAATNKICVWFTCSLQNNTANTEIDAAILVDGSFGTNTIVRSTHASGSQWGNAGTFYQTTLSAAAHTIKVQWQTAAGTAQVNDRRMMVMEFTA